MAFLFFGISFFILEIFTCMFLYYVIEESDDVIVGFIKTAQHSIKNISRSIKAVFFKLGTRNVHNIRNRIAPMLLPWQHSWLQSLSVKKKYPHLQPLLSGTEVLAWNTHGCHIVLTLSITLLGVDKS